MSSTYWCSMRSRNWTAKSRTCSTGTSSSRPLVPMEQVRDFAVQFVDRMEHQYVELMEEIQSTGNLSGVAVETIRAALADYKKEKLPGN